MASRTRTMWLFNFALLGVLWCSSACAQNLPSGQCDVTTGGIVSPACPSGNPNGVINIPPNNPDMVAATNPPYQAARSDMGSAMTPIDVWNYCRYVDNGSAGISIFVPFNTNREWSDFLAKAPNFVSLEHCSKPTSFSIPPNDPNNPSPPCLPVTLPPQPANYPYARFDQTTGTGSTQTVTLQFACKDASGNPWIETVTATSTGLDSDTNNPSWTPPVITYSGNAAIYGQCGAANGNSYATAASVNAAGLCNAGTASPTSVTDPGPWGWECDGTNGGTNAGCSASLLASYCALPHEGICFNGQVCYVNNLQDYPLCVSGATMSNYTDTRIDDVETMTGTCSENGGGQNCVRIITHQCVPPNC